MKNKNTLTRKEKEFARRAASTITDGSDCFTCYAIQRIQGLPVYDTSELKKKYADFYAFTNAGCSWGDLPTARYYCTQETQLQRELMLELFAHVGEIK